jgi:hypothetical protein
MNPRAGRGYDTALPSSFLFALVFPCLNLLQTNDHYSHKSAPLASTFIENCSQLTHNPQETAAVPAQKFP